MFADHIDEINGIKCSHIDSYKSLCIVPILYIVRIFLDKNVITLEPNGC